MDPATSDLDPVLVFLNPTLILDDEPTEPDGPRLIINAKSYLALPVSLREPFDAWLTSEGLLNLLGLVIWDDHVDFIRLTAHTTQDPEGLKTTVLKEHKNTPIINHPSEALLSAIREHQTAHPPPAKTSATPITPIYVPSQDWLGVVLDQLAAIFPALRTEPVSCPAESPRTGRGDPRCRGVRSIGGVIQHLNDYHRWTREKIADWCETLPIDLTVHPTSQGD